MKTLGSSEIPGGRPAPSVVRSATLFGGGTLVSRFLGLIRETLIFNVLPLNMADVFFLAAKLPNLFRRLLGEGALSVSFIPVFVGLKDKEPQAAKKLFHSIFTLLLVTCLSLTLLGWIYMEPVVEFLAGGRGFLEIPGKLELTVEVARYCFLFLIFITLFALFMAVLNGLHRFGWTGLAPAFLNLSLIGGALAVHFTGSAGPWLLVVAFLIGGFLQMAVLLPDLLKEGFWPKLSFDWSSEPLRRVFRAFGPSLIGLGSLQITVMINTYFAARLDPGTVTYINMADRLLELPLSLIAVSLQTALLPTLSGYWAKGQVQEMLACSEKHLKINYSLALPAAVGLFVLALPMAETLFSWRSSGSGGGEIIAQIVQVYAFTLLTASGTRLVAQNFYAMGNTLTPGMVSAVVTLLHVFVAGYLTDQMGLLGLNLATLISSALNMLMLLALQRRATGAKYWRGFLDYAKLLLASLAMGLILWQALPLWSQELLDGKLMQIGLLAAEVLGGALIYYIALRLLKFTGLSELESRLLRRWRRG